MVVERQVASIEQPATRPTTRERIVDVSADLMRRQGYAATGVKQIVTAAQAPFGSLYHHFPGGKEQLGAEAIRASGRALRAADPGRVRSGARPADGGPCVLRRGGRAPEGNRLRRRLPDRDGRARGVELERGDA